MSFFDPIPQPDDLDDDLEQPEWIAPPDGVIGGVVASQLLLWESPVLMIAATHITTYPTGIAFQIAIAARAAEAGPDAPALDPDGLGMDAITALRVGVLYPDGRKAQTGVERWSDEGDPEGPVLWPGGGGGGERSWRQDYWLWPAPPPGDLLFVVEWPGQGVPESRATLAGALLAEAWERTFAVWAGPPAPRQGWGGIFGITAAEPPEDEEGDD